MGITELFWAFLIFSALQPLVRQKPLEISRLRLLRRLEQKRGSLVIALALKRHRGKVTVFVPHYAMSGGTLIALAADAIVMDENAVLGPVDPQIGQSPTASLLTVLEQKHPKDTDDQTLILIDVARKAIAQVRAAVGALLADRLPDAEADALADKLSTGTWTHDYPITAAEAKALGLPVSTDVPPEIYQFMSFFPQPTRTMPTVEYVPLPHRKAVE